ncbi:thiamine/thiamine pyrophosphate ABC transporter permease [Orbus sturtevantii]|uniref:thiamine/thiamine pyrophosphate ABC transporter permease n=1 Tax=Orbus sturtevantii TaxID=3074109 RepID=UPI00370D1DCA
MATSRQPIAAYLPGIMVVIFITTIVVSALASLWWFAFTNSDEPFYFDSYLWQIILFTFIQATLSTIISVILAVFFAKAIYQNHFIGKAWLLRLLSLTFVLPSLVVVTGLIAVYGAHGWIAKLCLYMNMDYSFSIYGLNGILIAHVFLNFPFASKYCYQSLLLIPNQQRQLAEQLGLSPVYTFRYLELPVLIKQLLPLSGLIFMLCFSSFAIVLALSGGPKYTTIEVAIYQAVRDFELNQAVILSCIQLLFCCGFLLLLKRLEPKKSPLLINNNQPYVSRRNQWQNYGSYSIVAVGALFISLPLLTIVFEGIYHASYLFLTKSLVVATFTSIIVAVCSAVLAMLQAILLLWTNSRLQFVGKNKLSEILMLLGTLILAVPSMVLSAGFFIVFYRFSDTSGVIFILVVISNSLLALPFILKQLSVPLTDLTKQYGFLSQSLNIKGFRYFYLIEFKALKKLFVYSFTLACIMSLGDFGIIALFGGQQFMTLPYYLYELISHYRYPEASFSALLLLLISFLFMTLFEYSHDDRT